MRAIARTRSEVDFVHLAQTSPEKPFTLHDDAPAARP